MIIAYLYNQYSTIDAVHGRLREGLGPRDSILSGISKGRLPGPLVLAFLDFGKNSARDLNILEKALPYVLSIHRERTLFRSDEPVSINTVERKDALI